ncbi:oxygen-dependent protoporphyrinogen oxidase [Catalinimonas alkaloidigena]|uniref:Coproporphyrinogen III oxidase n=1 Tax=Catalinimonas alkaloidigena TaxID=1075417 RepID=A0A1G9K331_9BACT|nr:protoporphyrinogen oxidase [Catalinimonas alkaloidigena]SDL44062.1 oxygen-dependent protoporphyrinogen oxidase [Catalinimonas alkaloidigena]
MIGIIGAGISGLSLAYELQKRGIDYELWEASGHSGGVITTQREGPYLFELGPNSILVDQEVEAFVREVVPEGEIQLPNPISEGRYIYRDGAYQKLPAKPNELLFSNYFSLATKWAILRETTRRGQLVPNETLADFFARRFTQEVVDYAVTPFVSGIYFGDPRQLLVEKTFPMLAEYEQKYGSIVRGFAQQKGTQRRKSLSFHSGMQTLPKSISAQLHNVLFKHYVTSVDTTDDGFLLEIRSPDSTTTVAVDQLVLCAPAAVSATLLEPSFPQFAKALSAVHCPPMVAVHTVYKRAHVAHPLDGFGGLHPKVENLFSGGSIWSSSVFDGRCPDDEVLLTTFVGGSLSPTHLDLPEEEIMSRVHQELKELYGIRADRPVRQRIAWWPNGIPQYDRHINPVYEQAAAAESRRLYSCASWQGGVSLADCIKKARRLAERLSASV